jgi:peptidoglycan-associated lipoprotein
MSGTAGTAGAGMSGTEGAGRGGADADARQGERRPPVKQFSAVSDLLDVHFGFDRYDIHPAEAKVLESNARWLKQSRDLVLIEGHCDERGTSEYNLALGERRAASVMNYLVSYGIAAHRITIVSYGKERPQCTGHDEACWAKNRRAHFLVKRG